MAPVEAVNQDTHYFGLDTDLINPSLVTTALQGFEAVSQLANGQLDLGMFDSGYNDTFANEGVFYASNLLSTRS